MKNPMENFIFWEQKVKERTESGLTIEQWCDKNKLSKHKYHYWNHRIKENQKKDKEIAFAEVTPILCGAKSDVKQTDKPLDYQIFFKNMQITVPSKFDKDSLAELLKIMHQL